jgi:hypothetical protein
MANRAIQPRPSAPPLGRRSPALSVLALQRAVGNAATRRLLARSPRKPYQHQWENPALLETIYPARDVMLRKFVSMYREIELRDLTDPAARQKVIDETRAAMEAEIKRLKTLTAPSKKDLARIAELEAVLKRGSASGAKAFEDAVNWERRHRADPLAGAALMAEVKRLFGTTAVPDWLEPLVLDYAGMRYKTAHGSYYSPARLLYIIERARGTWTKAAAEETAAAGEAYTKRKTEWDAADPKKRGKAPAKPKAVTQSAAERSALELPAQDAVARLEKMHDAGEIPEWAWHKIVRLTELRIWYAEPGWEDESKEKPPPGADPLWVKALTEWTGDKHVGKHGYGATGWRQEIRRRNVLVTTRMVCEQLSEATQIKRGIELGGGLNKNAQSYVTAAAEGAKPGAKQAIRGSYFKEPASLADLRPGAGLFWIEDSFWDVTKPDDSKIVIAVAGARYPMPPPPGYVKEWKAWAASDEGKAEKKLLDAYKKEKGAWEQARKAWDVKAAKAKTQDERAKLGAAPVEPTKPKTTEPEYNEPKLLPADGQVVNGWTYAVKPGAPITRTKDGVTHWMTWKHQGTVLRAMPDGRVFTFETWIERVGATEHHGTGFGVRGLADLARPGVFVGYMPGEVDAPLAPAAPAELPIPEEVEFLIKVLEYDF